MSQTITEYHNETARLFGEAKAAHPEGGKTFRQAMIPLVGRANYVCEIKPDWQPGLDLRDELKATFLADRESK